MPELPEVETIVRDLRKKVIGHTITKVIIHDSRVVRQKSPAAFSRRLQGQKLLAIHRRGKAIIIDLEQSCEFLIVQLMMTGQLISSTQKEPGRDTKVSLKLSNQAWLHYNDYRTFGRLQVVKSLVEIPYFAALGPEPLEPSFSPGWLSQALLKKKTPIKPLLLNHTFVAGIGNIYASEILFASRIHPQRRAESLTHSEVARLHQNTQSILRAAIRSRGTSMNTYRDANGNKGEFMNLIKVYGRDHEPCLDCRAPVVRQEQSGRSTFYCPQCQV